MLYEIVILIRPDIAMSHIKEDMRKLQAVVQEKGGKVVWSEYCGFRSLAYRIEKRRKSHYVLFHIEASAPVLDDLSYYLKFNRDVIRFFIVKIEEAIKRPTSLFNGLLFEEFSPEETTVQEKSSDNEEKKSEHKFDIDYKNTRLLQRFITESGKIIPSRISKLSRKQQSCMALAIKRARFISLLPYIAR